MTTALWSALGTVAAAALWIAVPTALAAISWRCDRRARGGDKVLYLTFDDGPQAGSTERILGVLSGHGAKGTFFVEGRKAEEHPSLVDRIRSEGHTLGQHGYAHAHPWKTGPLAVWRDIRAAQRAFAGRDEGRGPLPYRPPYGKVNLLLWSHCLFSGTRIVLWDVDPKDYRETDPSAVAERAVAGCRSGAIVLLHDGRRGRGAPPEVTAAAVEMILIWGRSEGYRFEALHPAAPVTPAPR